MRQITLHPLFDEWSDEHLLYATDAQRVTLSAPVRSFIESARFEGLRPVLVTGERATVSPFVSDAMRQAGGHWAFRSGGGLFDALSGLRIAQVTDLWRDASADRPRHPAYAAPAPQALGVFMFDVYAQQRAEEATTIGPLAEHLIAGLGGGEIERWGLEEPLTTPWRHHDVTASMRSQMPASERHLVGATDGSFASIAVGRTRRGLIEHVRGGVPAGPYGAPFGAEPGSRLALHPRLTSTLTELAERFRPTVALVSYGELEWSGHGYGQQPRARRMDVPLAVLVGARAVRDVGIDPGDLIARGHDVTVQGQAAGAQCAGAALR